MGLRSESRESAFGLKIISRHGFMSIFYKKYVGFFAIALLIGVSQVFAQEGASTLGKDLLQDPTVKAAVMMARQIEESLIKTQISLCEVPAPPFAEDVRASLYREMFEKLGLENVRTDRVGNVLGERPGLTPHPHLVFSAHLDTVFPKGTNVEVTRVGTVLEGPGIADDCRGLAVVLGVIRALDAAEVQTQGTITFVGTVGEEGLGDLRGVRHLFNEELKGRIDRFVSVDGTGLGITHVSVGSHRYRVTFKGPGGHSFGEFGLANPVHALGRAIGLIADLQVPREPKTTFSVGRIGGGTSVNSIAFEAWMEVDMRSLDPNALQALDSEFQEAIGQALFEENKRWGDRGVLTVEIQPIGNRPAGVMSEESPIVQTAVSVSRALELSTSLDAGSTDANVPMSLGIPAITINGGGSGSGAHSLGERFDTRDSWKGTQRATLLAIALSQP